VRAGTDDLAAVVDAAATAARSALARTPSQLPALARAGVVDAGGRGLVVLLDALAAVVTGVTPTTTPLARVVRDDAQLVTRRETGSTAYAYEVQFLLDARAEAVATLKDELKSLGDSVVIVGAGAGETDTWNVHAHVNDVGAAIEAGIEAGRPHRISVTRFDDTPETPFDPHARATVVVARGAGLERLFAAEGAAVVSGTSPSTVDLLLAIVESGAGNVVLLPNDANVRAVATAAADEARARGQAVAVVHTKSPVQAIAALAVRDAERRFDEDVIAMAEAAAATRWAEVTVAVRDALTLAGPCRAGDVLGLVEGEVVLIAAELQRASTDLLDRMLGGGGELVTLVIGADAPKNLAAALEAHVREKWPFVEAQVYDGGQPHYPLLVGVE
jgi:DAK2 domain fusion protein YloV